MEVPAGVATLRSRKLLVPWLVMVGLFVVTAIYVIVSVPGTDLPTQSSAPPPTSHSDGLTDRHGGYQLEPVALPTGRGQALPVAFRILGPDGSPTADYVSVQTVPLHLYVVREDLSAYQHVHPRLMGDTWHAAVSVPDGGVYRLYAEFTPTELAATAHPIVLGTQFVITGDTAQIRPPAETSSVTVGPFTVSRLDAAGALTAGVATVLWFQVLGTDAKPASLEPYLGAFAHVSAFDELTQAITHLHPTTPPNAAPPRDATLTFHTVFPDRGRQRLFLQFQVAGTVHLAEFTVVVR